MAPGRVMELQNTMVVGLCGDGSRVREIAGEEWRAARPLPYMLK